MVSEQKQNNFCWHCVSFGVVIINCNWMCIIKNFKKLKVGISCCMNRTLSDIGHIHTGLWFSSGPRPLGRCPMSCILWPWGAQRGFRICRHFRKKAVRSGARMTLIKGSKSSCLGYEESLQGTEWGRCWVTSLIPRWCGRLYWETALSIQCCNAEKWAGTTSLSLVRDRHWLMLAGCYEEFLLRWPFLSMSSRLKCCFSKVNFSHITYKFSVSCSFKGKLLNFLPFFRAQPNLKNQLIVSLGSLCENAVLVIWLYV